ncbi:MAG: phage/plasmid primase, P4 family [Betaproteobacteria bacterium]
MSGEREAEVFDLVIERSRKRKEAAEAENATHHDLAHGWIEARSVDGFPPVYSNGSFYVPGPDGLWLRITTEQVQVEVARMFNGRKLCRKNSDFKQITDHIAALCEVEGFFDEAPPGVVSPAGFHVMSASGAIETEPLTLDHRQTFALDYRPEYEAEAPLLDGVLRAAFDGDDADAQVDLWWQAVGAALFGLMPRLQLVLLMLGRERSGKSLLQRVLERTFPAVAVGAVSPASWGHEYHVATLAGKRLNVVGELSDDAPIPAASFKNVTGQNLVAGRHPTHRPFSFRCQAAHVFASNVLPPTTDRSEAFYRRWRVLRFANTVPADKVDPDLLDKIVANEMPAVLAQAFMGAERVARAGRMRTTLAHDAVLDRWRHNANPLQQFLGDDEWVDLDPEARTHSKTDVYETYRKWAAAAGFRNPFSRNHFIDLLESTGATRGVFIKRVGTREVVVGVRLLASP